MRRLERRVIVPIMDEGWCLHLAELDAIFRQARSGPAAEFADIYRARAQESYGALLDYIRENVTGYLFHLEDTA
jgi:preprotein translocase subunit SecA